jgi:hypothetical protein
LIRKLQVVMAVLCMLSNAAAGTVSIGTASARGDMRVDSYMVKGNATLFDGSVVETGEATVGFAPEQRHRNHDGYKLARHLVSTTALCCSGEKANWRPPVHFSSRRMACA